ncbi:14897_t:CDS:2, partial [Racocetra fulgida]
MEQLIIIKTNKAEKIKNFLDQEKQNYKVFNQTKRKKDLFANYEEANDMMIKRGEVYKFRVSRKETEGSEQQKDRPAIYDFEVPVIVGGKRGKALCDQIKVYNETRLIKKEERLGVLSEKEMKEIGKSTLSRALAVEATRAGLKTLLADCDPGQETSYKWSKRREREPKITAQVFSDFATAYQAAQKGKYDLLIIDGPAMISAMTKEIAQQSDYIIQPVKPYLDDLEPAVVDYNSLVKAGIKKDKLILALNQVLNTNSEKDARDYLATTPYKVLKNSLPERVSYGLAQNEGWAITEILHPSLKTKTEKFLEELINTAPTTGSDNLKREEVSRKDSPAAEPKLVAKKNNSYSITKRTRPLTTKISPVSYDLLVKIAYQKRRKMVEILEEGIELEKFNHFQGKASKKEYKVQQQSEQRVKKDQYEERENEQEEVVESSPVESSNNTCPSRKIIDNEIYESRITEPSFGRRDGRYLTRTNRTVYFGTKVTPEFDEAIRRLAHEQDKLITEMLEEFLAAYLEQQKKSSPTRKKS